MLRCRWGRVEGSAVPSSRIAQLCQIVYSCRSQLFDNRLRFLVAMSWHAPYSRTGELKLAWLIDAAPTDEGWTPSKATCGEASVVRRSSLGSGSCVRQARCQSAPCSPDLGRDGAGVCMWE
jgi:hypothetical protein